MSESRGRYELGHLNLRFAEAALRLDVRLQRDRRGDPDPEYGLKVGPGMYEEICGVLAALAGAKAEGRRQGLEEAAKEAEDCNSGTYAAAVIRSLAIASTETQKPETQKPETGEPETGEPETGESHQ